MLKNINEKNKASTMLTCLFNVVYLILKDDFKRNKKKKIPFENITIYEIKLTQYFCKKLTHFWVENNPFAGLK